VTQVHTKGTIVSFVDENQYLPNYLIAVSKHNNLIGYSLLEMSTNLIMVGYSDSLDSFKTVLFQTRPVELLYDPDNLSLEIVEMVKQNWLQMVLTRLPNRDNLWHPMNARSEVENLVNSGVFNMPAVFESLEKVGGEHEKLILATLSGMFRYLKNCLKFDYIMSAVRFNFYEKEGSAMTMVMDSQALQHLEIFETPLGEKDSLFCKIDRTHTKFGKRLLRRWMMQPLLDPHKINQRLDAVEDLEAISIDRNRVAEVFSKLPDL
jgi:DNA mismatch repair ATPase MutS